MVDPSKLLSISNITLSYKDYHFLENLDKLASRCLSKNKVAKAVSYMSQSLNLRKALYGESSQRYKAKLSEVFSAVFPVALQQLERGEFENSIKSLNSLQEIFQTSALSAEKAEIFNSLACNYIKLKDWQQAKSCIKRALTEATSNKTLSSIYLNLARVHTHALALPKAISACKKAIHATQEALVQSDGLTSKNIEFLITNLAFSYYSLGKIYQNTSEKRNAAKWYTKAIVFLKNNAGPTQQGLLHECFKKHREVLSESSTDEGTRPVIKKVASQASNFRTKTPIERSIFPAISLRKLPLPSGRMMNIVRRATPVKTTRRTSKIKKFKVFKKPGVPPEEYFALEHYARKLQAFYRGARQREKFELMKKHKSKVIDRIAKKFDQFVMLTLSDNCEVTVYSEGQEYKKQFIEQIQLGDIYFSKELGIFKLINQRRITIRSTSYDLRAYQNNQTLLIHLKLNKIFQLSLNIPEFDEPLIFLEELIPKLDVENDSIILFTPKDINHIKNIQSIQNDSEKEEFNLLQRTQFYANRKDNEIQINVLQDPFDDFIEPFQEKQPETKEKTPEDYAKIIQRSWRNHQRSQLSGLKKQSQQRKQLIGRKGMKLHNTYLLISVYTDNKKTYISAYSPENSQQYSAESRTIYDFSYVLHNLEFTGTKILFNSSESDDSSSSEEFADIPVLSIKRSMLGKKATVNIYQEASSYYLEILGEGLFFSNRFTFEELFKIYKTSQVTPETLCQSVYIYNSEVYLDPTSISTKAQESERLPPPLEDKIILRTTKNSSHKMYTVVMHLKRKSMTGNELKDEDLLHFEIYANSSNKKTVSITLSKASEQTGIPKDNLVPLGNYLISRMLVITDYYIGFDSNVPSVNLSNVATRLQAAYKGYMARKQMMQFQTRSSSMLTISKDRIMAGKMYVVNAYDRGSRIKLEARCENEVLCCFVQETDFSAFEEGLDREQVIEKVIIPSLYILELNDTKQLCIESNFQIHAQRLDNLKLAAKSKQESDRTYKPLYRRRMNISPISSHAILPTVLPRRSLILKTFANVSGKVLEVSFIDDGILVIETEHLKLHTSRFINRLTQKEKEKICLELVPMLRIKGNRLFVDEDMSEVLYKNTHWVKDKFMSVCVLTNDHATSLEATDLESQQIYSFKLSSNRRKKSSFHKDNIDDLIRSQLAIN